MNFPRQSPSGKIIVPRTATALDWAADGVLDLQALPAGHQPGVYDVGIVFVVLETGGGTATRSYLYTAPRFGPTTIGGFGGVSLGTLGNPAVSFTVVSVASDGSAPIVVRMTPAGVSGTPRADVYASAALRARLS